MSCCDFLHGSLKKMTIKDKEIKENYKFIRYCNYLLVNIKIIKLFKKFIKWQKKKYVPALQVLIDQFNLERGKRKERES